MFRRILVIGVLSLVSPHFASAQAPSPTPQSQTPGTPPQTGTTPQAGTPSQAATPSQTAPPAQTAKPLPTATPTQAVTPPDPTVLCVFNATKRSWAEDAELKDALKVRIAGLKAWRGVEKNSRTPLHLFLGGMPLENVVAVPSELDADEQKQPPGSNTCVAAAGADVSTLLVTLDFHNDTSDKEGRVRKAWVRVIQTAHEADRHRLDVSVGPAGQAPFASDGTGRNVIELDVYPWYTGLIVAFLALVIGGVIYLGYASNLLRDSNGATNPPYSLAKHQMAVWFVVVVGVYLYIWLVTGLFAWTSTTALALIGISGATGLVAVTMDASKRNEAAKARMAVEAERDALVRELDDPVGGLRTQLHALPPGSPAAPALLTQVTPKAARLNELNAVLAVPSAAASSNEQWIKDLLSDEHGISFHRLQIAIWTLVLVMVFIKAVYDEALMPEFDVTLLGLLGISSGTYLGFKFPEKPA